MMDHGMNGGWLGTMGLFHLLFWILVIAGVALIIKWLWQRPAQDSPLEILKRRYARGEIDRETYQRMKRELEDGPQ